MPHRLELLSEVVMIKYFVSFYVSIRFFFTNYDKNMPEGFMTFYVINALTGIAIIYYIGITWQITYFIDSSAKNISNLGFKFNFIGGYIISFSTLLYLRIKSKKLINHQIDVVVKNGQIESEIKRGRIIFILNLCISLFLMLSVAFY